jgi:hypothetical protein
MYPRQKAKGKRQESGARPPVVILALLGLWGMPGAHAVDTFVGLDVVTGDPNDPNGTPPLIEATPGQTVNYAITAIVYTDPNDQTSDPDVTKGLGAVYLTLNTDFGDANLVGAPNEIVTPLGTTGLGGQPLACLGIRRGDDITDIGGSQDLLGETSTPVELANGQRVVLAEGTVTLPSANGVYRVWVTARGDARPPSGGGNGASPVSVLQPNLTQPPFGRPADEVRCGQGFYAVIGQYDYYTLTLASTDPNLGTVRAEPDLPNYPDGMSVTLTASPHPGEHFDYWRHFDPNYPGDVNCADRDDNNPTTVVMDRDREVLAIWCGTGSGSLVPLTALGILGIARFVRRRR